MDDEFELSLDALKSTVRTATFCSSKSEDVAVSVLMARFIELVDAVVDCSKSNTKIGVPILLSSLLEVYCHLVSIVNEKNNCNYLLIESAKSRKRVLNAIDNGVENDFLPGKDEIENFEAQLERVRSVVSFLNKKGFGSGGGFKGLFSRAGLDSLYFSVYFSVCNHKHSNYSTMLKRHLEGRKTDGGVKVVYDAPLPEKDIEAYMGTMHDLVVQAERLLTPYVDA
ncbi:MAG: hypothetical protein ACJATD_000102 [Alloalcanivorax sp.]|jgi:hypothetical protein